MASIKKVNEERYTVKANGKPRKLALMDDLCFIGQKSFLDILPSARNYNTIETGYNSKERMAHHLFRKIIRAYIKISIRKIVSGATYCFPCKGKFKVRLVLNSSTDFSYLVNKKDIHNQLVFKNYIYFNIGDFMYSFNIYGSNRLRKLIVKEYEEGNTFYEQTKDLL
jgi:hypothetical protein